MEAAEVDADDPAIELLESPEIVIGSPSSEDTDEGRELLYVLAAWYGMGFGDPHTHDLREPLYGLACSYELANFVLAPLLDPADEYGDPFRAWFGSGGTAISLRFDVRNRQCVITRGREVSDVGLDA